MGGCQLDARLSASQGSLLRAHEGPTQFCLGMGSGSHARATRDLWRRPVAVKFGRQPQRSGSGGALRVRTGNDKKKTRDRRAILPAEPAANPALRVTSTDELRSGLRPGRRPVTGKIAGPVSSSHPARRRDKADHPSIRDLLLIGRESCVKSVGCGPDILEFVEANPSTVGNQADMLQTADGCPFGWRNACPGALTRNIAGVGAHLIGKRLPGFLLLRG